MNIENLDALVKEVVAAQATLVEACAKSASAYAEERLCVERLTKAQLAVDKVMLQWRVEAPPRTAWNSHPNQLVRTQA
jgi:hypothetical protein